MSNMATEDRSAAEKAAVISVIGVENASEVLRHLSEGEIEQLSVELSRLPKISSGELEEISKDFYECCVTEKVIAGGGREYAKEVLEKAFGQQQARSMMDRVSKALHTKSFSFIRKVDYKSLMAVIQNEHPQTLAFILSYANAEQASKIIAELPGDIRIDVVERIAGMERAYPPIVKVVEEVVRGKIGVSASEDAMEIGGLNYVADVMNHVCLLYTSRCV